MANWNVFPLEIRLMILVILTQDPYCHHSSYATVSEEWQMVLGKHSF